MTDAELHATIEKLRAKIRRRTEKKIALEREIHELAIAKMTLIIEQRERNRRASQRFR